MAEEINFEYCESCGIRLMKKEDHGSNNLQNKWCINCCNSDGSHKPREDVKKNIVRLFMSIDAYKVMGEKLTQEEAEQLAEEYMKKMPAWSKESE